jgi:cell shape-determining protein MreC
VVAEDLLSWRDSRLIDAGTLRGIRRGAPVATRWFTVDVGAEQGAADGMAVLAGEVLIGWVEQAGTHTARVRLLTDPTTRMSVAVGRFDGPDFRRVPVGADVEFWLEADERGRLRIVDVDHRYVEGEDGIRSGDRVVTLADDPQLPVSMTIGVVTESKPDPENPLLYTLTVESAVRQRIAQVYVLELSGR